MDFARLNPQKIAKLLSNIAEDLVTLAVQEAPQDTGDLRHSIRVLHKLPNLVTVGIDQSKLGKAAKRKNIKPWRGKWYPELVHSGTRPHKITPINCKALSWQTASGVRQVKTGARAGQYNKYKKNNQYAFAKSVNHPGTKPNPYFQRAITRLMPKLNELNLDNLIQFELPNEFK